MLNEGKTATGGARERLGLIGVAVLAVAIIAVLVATNIARSSAPASAIQAALNGQQLRIMAPANPGGGWDQTSRALQTALGPIAGRIVAPPAPPVQEERLFSTPA